MFWLINTAGLSVIGLIVWWFWFSRPKTRAVGIDKPIEIIVADGVYTPSRIEVPVGKAITLRFIRKDPSPCAEKVLFDDLDVSSDLSLNKPTDVTFSSLQPGSYPFSCQMRMYKGELIAK